MLMSMLSVDSGSVATSPEAAFSKVFWGGQSVMDGSKGEYVIMYLIDNQKFKNARSRLIADVLQFQRNCFKPGGYRNEGQEKAKESTRLKRTIERAREDTERWL